MTELRVRPEAEVDAFEAATWYEREREGLGSAFFRRLGQVFERIENGPLQFPLVTDDIRRALLGRFPFGVFFLVENGSITGHRCDASSSTRARGNAGDETRLRAKRVLPPTATLEPAAETCGEFAPMGETR